MKKELLNILIQLKETNSWDLAEELARGVYKKDKIEPRLVDSLIGFLNITIKKSSFTQKEENLIKARDMMVILRNKEKEERQEEQNELESLLNF